MKEKNIIENKSCGSASSNKPRTRTIIIPIEKLLVCPHNPRKRDLDLDELVKSIKEDDVKEVIEVHPHGEVWHVIAGQRRFLAAKKAGITEVECLEYSFGEEEAEDWCMHDAFHKKEYNSLDLVELAVKAVAKYGSISKASKATGISESKLKKYHGARGLIKEVKNKIGSLGTKTLAVDTLRKISQFPDDKQLEVYEAVKEKTRSQAERILNRIESETLTDVSNKKSVEETEVILIELTSATYENLKVKAKEAKTTLGRFCKMVLEEKITRESPSSVPGGT